MQMIGVMKTATTTIRSKQNRKRYRVVETNCTRKDRTMNKSTKGFTLTDMLVVVSVVGMVAMMVLPKL